MANQAFIERALNGEVWQIGQLDAPTVRALDRLAKSGRLVKERDHWCGIKLKTVWRAA